MEAKHANIVWFESESDFKCFVGRLNILGTTDWSEWQDFTQKTISALNRFGIIAIKEHVYIDDFISWCQDEKKVPTKEALHFFLNK